MTKTRKALGWMSWWVTLTSGWAIGDLLVYGEYVSVILLSTAFLGLTVVVAMQD